MPSSILNPPSSQRWFFEEPASIDALRAEIDSWLDTPFHAYSKAKGRTGGVDCIRLCEAIMVACGVVEPFEFPRVPMDFTQHNDRSIVLEYLRGDADDTEAEHMQSSRLSSAFAELPSDLRPPTSVPMPGDLYAFQIGKAVNHIAIAYDETRFVHCLKGIGTVLANITDPTFASRLHSVFRARA